MWRERNRSMILSYLGLRRLIGILGILLPLICIAGGYLFSGIGIQPSVSAYYHTNIRDFFVGLMVCTAFFLATYKGYERIDTLASISAGVSGFGLAIFPCLEGEDIQTPVGILQLPAGSTGTLHLVFSILFFIILALISLFLFRLSDKKKEERSRGKIRRNRVYLVCGLVMLVSLFLLLMVFLWVPPHITARYKLILIGETIMLLSFGTSWLTKGKALHLSGKRRS